MGCSGTWHHLPKGFSTTARLFLQAAAMTVLDKNFWKDRGIIFFKDKDEHKKKTKNIFFF